jgi:hypothetical protein
VAQKAIRLNVKDNVATALTDLEMGETIEISGAEGPLQIALREAIRFGHKYALRDIAQGEDVLKYGLPIGKAMEAICAGEWVHVHNCRSDRFGHRHQKYGVNA